MPTPSHSTGTVPFGTMLAAALLLIAGCSASFGDFDPFEDEVDPFSNEALNFLVVGDWGRGGWFRQDDVAAQMAETAEGIGSRFVISTGDNFYEKGVASVADPKWQRSFVDVYDAPALQVPWFVVLGNHDYRGDVGAQIAYSRLSERWTLPARYYAVEFAVDDTTQVLFLFLDTVALVDGESASTPDINRADWDPDRQLRWVDSTLTASEAAWRFAVGHHPIYSASAKHGDRPLLRQRLAPLLRRHGVQAYVSGHVHSLQHLAPPGDDLHYFVSGAGSLARKVAPDTAVRFAAGVSGFMAASLTPDELHVRFIDYRGTLGYATSIPRVRTTDAHDTGDDLPFPDTAATAARR